MDINALELLNIICDNCDIETANNIIDKLNIDYEELAGELDLNDLDNMNETNKKILGPIYIKASAIDDILETKIDPNDPLFKEESIRTYLDNEALKYDNDVDFIEKILRSNLVYYTGYYLDDLPTPKNQCWPYISIGSINYDNEQSILSENVVLTLLKQYVKLSGWYHIMDSSETDSREDIYVKDRYGIYEWLFDYNNIMKNTCTVNYVPEMDKFFDENEKFIGDKWDYIDNYLIPNFK